MKYYKFVNSFILFLLIFIQLTGMEKCNVHVGQKYELKKLFEKPIADNYNDTSLYLLHSRSKYHEKNCILYEEKDVLMPDIPCPGLVAVDRGGNYYISNANENLKVFDKKGNFIYKFDFPDQYYGTFSPFDEDENIYLFMNREINNTKDTIVYRINISDRKTVILNKKEISELDNSLVPPRNSDEVVAKKKREQGKNGIYYEVQPSALKIKTIYKNKDGRFVSPEQLIVYRIDESFDYQNVIPGDKYLHEKLDIPSLCSDKIIYICTHKSDKDGNIFVSGVQANETEQIKISVYNEDKNAVKVYKLKFFIWEFSKKY